MEHTFLQQESFELSFSHMEETFTYERDTGSFSAVYLRSKKQACFSHD